MTTKPITKSFPHGAACATCPAFRPVERLGVDVEHWDYVVALAGNPNTGKSTVFNALTGLRQHTGNWPGKTVTRAEGGFRYADKRFKLVDLPGTYSLLATSEDEEIARDFVLFGQPDVTVIVLDATHLERNLNLALQVLEITDRVVVALNLMDEAERRGLRVDARRLARELGVPVVPMVARRGQGISELIKAVHDVASGKIKPRPRRLGTLGDPSLEKAVARLTARVQRTYPKLPNARWVALRLLEGDPSVEQALRDGSLSELAQSTHGAPQIERLRVAEVGA